MADNLKTLMFLWFFLQFHPFAMLLLLPSLLKIFLNIPYYTFRRPEHSYIAFKVPALFCHKQNWMFLMYSLIKSLDITSFSKNQVTNAADIS